jgi:uncharacterized Zn finger protein (UPF0148 family)
MVRWTKQGEKMERECPKCGFLNPQATGSTIEACPTCGAIYAKAAVAKAHQRLATEQRRTNYTLSDQTWVVKLMRGFALLGAVAGLAQLAATIIRAESAPQQTAGACIAIAFAVIPYCAAQAIVISKS